MTTTMLLGGLAALTLVAGCKGKSTDEAGGPAPGASALAAATLDASGSTFQQGFQEVAIEAFTRAHPTIKINYGAGGSGKGRQDFADQVVDYACTDSPYKPAEASKLGGGAFVYIPNLLGPITVSVNIEGGEKLKLSPEVIARIFQREIKTWDDPAIAADNPGAPLPATPITVARRSDGSGTTENFTRYLTLAAPTVWKLKSGSTVEWPTDTQAGNGNSGVAQIVKSTRGAIGYVDLSDARASGLTYAAIKNQAGAYIEPTIEGATAAAEGVAIADDLIFSAVNATGAAAYPITAQSWCVLYTSQPDKATGAALQAYFRYMLTDGQKLLAEVDFAPLPKVLQERALAELAKVQVR